MLFPEDFHKQKELAERLCWSFIKKRFGFIEFINDAKQDTYAKRIQNIETRLVNTSKGNTPAEKKKAAAGKIKKLERFSSELNSIANIYKKKQRIKFYRRIRKEKNAPDSMASDPLTHAIGETLTTLSIFWPLEKKLSAEK
ncbi:MAG: hypothetical protein V1494_04470 [Candidatus Diapherotrites archaeon]